MFRVGCTGYWEEGYGPCDALTMTHTCDTDSGDMGGPLYELVGGSPFLRAVHSNELFFDATIDDGNGATGEGLGCLMEDI